MFKSGKYVLDKKTNEKCLVISNKEDFNLIKHIHGDGSVEGKFNWELEKYSFLKKIIRRFKKCKN